MIKLDPASVTTATSTRGGQTTTVVMDTLVVRYVEMNLVEGSILAIIDRGTVDPSTGAFVATDVPLWVDVRADGSFASRDGAWVGKVAAAPQITAGLKAAFDGFLLASGAVTGTAT
jgi:hypothetical protein